MHKNLIEQVLKTVRNYRMLKPGDKVMAAVSGGPDSVFLLEALVHLKNKFGVKKLIVCNLDHGLRGKESQEDSLFVKDLTEKLGLEFIHKTVDLKKAAKGDLSTEEIARAARYQFFREAASSAGVNVIATGHTLDDQAETILMRIVKGAALKGIVGISPLREDGDMMIVRPLIELEKANIVDYLNEKGMIYRIDSTNLKPVYFRNVVRSEIIPFLERYNPKLKRVLFNLAEHLREDFEFISDQKAEVSGRILSSGKNSAEIKLKDIAVQPRTIQKEILRDALERSGGEVKKLSFRHWKEMESLIRYKQKGSSVDLPGSIRVTRTGTSITFHRL